MRYFYTVARSLFLCDYSGITLELFGVAGWRRFSGVGGNSNIFWVARSLFLCDYSGITLELFGVAGWRRFSGVGGNEILLGGAVNLCSFYSCKT
jgi:hypothetical protein